MRQELLGRDDAFNAHLVIHWTSGPMTMILTVITMTMSKMMILTPYNMGYNIMKEGNTNDKNIY